MVQEAPSPAELRRQRRREARREEVLDAAMVIVEREGLAALTMPKLAREVDCAVGALYRSFSGKSALLVALQQQAIEALSMEIAQAVEVSRHAAAKRKRLSPAEASVSHLWAALDTVLTLPSRSPSRHRLIDELLSSSDAMLSDEELATVNVTLAGLLSRVTTLLHEAQVAGALQPGDVEVRARLLWASLHGLDHFRKRDRGEPPALRTPRLVEAMLASLFRGWGAGAQVETWLLGPGRGGC